MQIPSDAIPVNNQAPMGSNPGIITPPSSNVGSSVSIPLDAVPVGGNQSTQNPSLPNTTSGGTSGPFGNTDNNNGGIFTNTKANLQNVGNNLVNNTVKEAKDAFNISGASFSDFATQESNANDFGNSLTSVNENDFNSGLGQDALNQAGKGLANTLVGSAAMATNIGTFLWNANVHPIKTLETLASDPVGFATGLLPDSAKELIQGVLSAGKDVFTGNASQAGGDLGQGIQRAWTAFLDNPIQEVLKYSLVGDLLEAPAEIGAAETATKGGKSLSNVPGNLGTMTKSIFKPYTSAWDNIKAKGDVSEGIIDTGKGMLNDVSKSIKDILNTVKTGTQMFTKEGRGNLLAAQGLQAFNKVKADLDVNNLDTKIKEAMGANATEDEISQLQVQRDGAKQQQEKANSNFNGLQFTIVNYLDNQLGQKYTNVSNANTDFANSVKGLFSQKDQSYKSSQFQPDGNPVRINDITPFTDSLRNTADRAGESVGGAPASRLRSFASGADLRQAISQAGGEQAYIEAEVNRRLRAEQQTGGSDQLNSFAGEKLSPGSQPIKIPSSQNMIARKMELADDVRQEMEQTMKESEMDRKAMSKPWSAYDLQQQWSGLKNRMLPGEQSTLGHILTGKIDSSEDAYGNIMKDNLTRDNPNGYNDFLRGNDLYKKTLTMPGFKDANGNPLSFANTQDFIDFAKKNWNGIQNLDPQIQLKIQQTIASQIIHNSIDPGTPIKAPTLNFNKLKAQLVDNASFLDQLPEVKQILNENTLDLSKVVSGNKDLQAKVAELYGGKTPEQINSEYQNQPKPEQIQQTEEQIKEAQNKQKVIGTDAQEILSKVKGLKSIDDFNEFMANSKEQDPSKIGEMIKQDTFERNNPSANIEGGPTPRDIANGMFKTYTELNNLFKGEGVSTQLRSKFFPDSTSIKDGLRQFTDLKKLSDSVDKTQTKLGAIVNSAIAVSTYLLGWHFQTIRFASKVLNNESPIPKMDERGAEQVIEDANTPSATRSLLKRVLKNTLLLQQGYQKANEDSNNGKEPGL